MSDSSRRWASASPPRRSGSTDSTLDATILGLSMLLAVLAWWFGSVEVDAGRVTLSFTGIVMLAAMSLDRARGCRDRRADDGPLPRRGGPAAGPNLQLGHVRDPGGRRWCGLHRRRRGPRRPGTPSVPGRRCCRSASRCWWPTSCSSPSTWCSSRSSSDWLRASPCAPRWGASSGRAVRRTSDTASSPSAWWCCGALLDSARPASSSSCLRCWWRSGPTGSTPRRSMRHERALQVLVAAVEAKAPHLVGHSTRVAELSASMAEHLGLRSQVVADARVAGMLHDLGLTTLPTGLVRSTSVVGGSGLGGYPARGVRLLTGLSFLSGALDAIAHHRDAVLRGAAGDSESSACRRSSSASPTSTTCSRRWAPPTASLVGAGRGVGPPARRPGRPGRPRAGTRTRPVASARGGVGVTRLIAGGPSRACLGGARPRGRGPDGSALLRRRDPAVPDS